jgi:hypothetical protein
MRVESKAKLMRSNKVQRCISEDRTQLEEVEAGGSWEVRIYEQAQHGNQI